jgi:hypothetical protein
MPIKAILQTIAGKKLDQAEDSGYSLAAIWPFNDRSFPLLQYIDPYGNAVFNGLQMSEVQKELDPLIRRAANDEQRNTLRRIRELSVTCERQPHTFLRFAGD